jgi:hypothetical protein
MMRNVWLLAVFASSGCAVFASASVKHSHSGCVDDKSFAAIDFITTAGTGGVLIATGTAVDKPVSLVLPAVFLASGIFGLVEVARCRGPSRPRKRASTNYIAAPVVPAPLPLPSSGEPAVPPPLPVLLRVTRDPRPNSAQPTLPAPVQDGAPVVPAPRTPPAPAPSTAP